MENALWDPLSPYERECLFSVIRQLRMSFRVLGYDVLPRYSPDPDYEDDPPDYFPFIILPVSIEQSPYRL